MAALSLHRLLVSSTRGGQNLLDSSCWTVALKHLESGKWLFRQKRCPGEADVAVSTEPEAMVLVSEPFECGLVAGLMETGAGEVVVKDDHHPLLQSWSHHLQNLLHLAVQVAVHIRQGDVGRKLVRGECSEIAEWAADRGVSLSRDSCPATASQELLLRGVFASLLPAGMEITKAFGLWNPLKTVDSPEVSLHRQFAVDAMDQWKGFGPEASELDVIPIDAVEVEQPQDIRQHVVSGLPCAGLSLLLPSPVLKLLPKTAFRMRFQLPAADQVLKRTLHQSIQAISEIPLTKSPHLAVRAFRFS